MTRAEIQRRRRDRAALALFASAIAWIGKFVAVTGVMVGTMALGELICRLLGVG